MDKVAQHLFVFDGNGKITDFPSSYSDYMEWKQLKAQEEKARAQEEEKKRLAKLQQSGQSVQQNSTPSDRPAAKKLSFKEKREMEQIELELEQLEQERTSLEDLMNSGTLPFDQLSEKANRIGWIIDRIDEITLRWMELSERA